MLPHIRQWLIDLLYRAIGRPREPVPPWFICYWLDNRYKVTICKASCTLTIDYMTPRTPGTTLELPRTYPVAIGANPDGADKREAGDQRTPEGAFRVCQKLRLSRPHGGYGPYWLRLDTRRAGWEGIGIHGTNKPYAIGTKATAGCVRLHNDHITELYHLIPLGTLVEIVP